MKKWTVNSALSAVNAEVNGKVLIVTQRTGLTQCGALDFLRNHCGYTISFKN